MTELVRTYKLTDSGAWGWVTEEAEGGGGGSLPDWWTVDSTPGSESVEFAGAVTIQAAIGKNPLDVIFPAGSAKRIFFETEEGAAHRWSAEGGGIAYRYANADGDTLFDMTAAGAVTISPSDPTQNDQFLLSSPSTIADAATVFRVEAAETGNLLYADAEGAVNLGGNKIRVSISAGVGYFGANPVAQQQLDPVTCTTEDIANALIASTFMAAA